jgi:phage shock protein A
LQRNPLLDMLQASEEKNQQLLKDCEGLKKDIRKLCRKEEELREEKEELAAELAKAKKSWHWVETILGAVSGALGKTAADKVAPLLKAMIAPDESGSPASSTSEPTEMPAGQAGVAEVPEEIRQPYSAAPQVEESLKCAAPTESLTATEAHPSPPCNSAVSDSPDPKWQLPATPPDKVRLFHTIAHVKQVLGNPLTESQEQEFQQTDVLELQKQLRQVLVSFAADHPSADELPLRLRKLWSVRRALDTTAEVEQRMQSQMGGALQFGLSSKQADGLSGELMELRHRIVALCTSAQSTQQPFAQNAQKHLSKLQDFLAPGAPNEHGLGSVLFDALSVVHELLAEAIDADQQSPSAGSGPETPTTKDRTKGSDPGVLSKPEVSPLLPQPQASAEKPIRSRKIFEPAMDPEQAACLLRELCNVPPHESSDLQPSSEKDAADPLLDILFRSIKRPPRSEHQDAPFMDLFQDAFDAVTALGIALIHPIQQAANAGTPCQGHPVTQLVLELGKEVLTEHESLQTWLDRIQQSHRLTREDLDTMRKNILGLKDRLLGLGPRLETPLEQLLYEALRSIRRTLRSGQEVAEAAMGTAPALVYGVLSEGKSAV